LTHSISRALVTCPIFVPGRQRVYWIWVVCSSALVLDIQVAGAGGLYPSADRPHSALDGRTPDEVYAIDEEQEKLAA
ncbi:MAG: hypothetical protein M3R67_15280, partial [Acidobacteriota bacterium]|nr:hypothetical protein [Acidobacteriota bacterium]